MMRERLLAVLGFALLAAPAMGQGLQRESNDLYRSFPVTVRFRAFLPAEVDLSPAFPTPGLQGQQPSCTAWAVGYALRSYYEHWRQGWDIGDAHHIVSPAYIYDELAGPGSRCDKATAISAALNLLQKVGAPSLADVPYDPQKCWFDTPATVDQTFRIQEWRRVDLASLDNVKGELHNGNPIVFGLSISDQFYGLRGDAIYDDAESPRTLSHALVLVGYSERRQAFKYINSWGTGWGDNGFGWISYRAFAKLVDQAFVARVAALPPLYDFLASLAPGPAKKTVATVVRVPVIASPQPAEAAVVASPPGMKPKEITPLPPHALPAPERLSNPKLRQALQRFECADLKLVSGPRETRVAGFVSSEADHTRLLGLVAAADPSMRSSAEIVIRPWPQCEALLAFTVPLTHPRGLTLLVNGDRPSTLSGGETLTIDVTAPDFPSYLYVTYVESSGDAVHLLSPQGPLTRATAPGARIRIGGGGPGQNELHIAPPFGDEMIVAVASASPLFAEPRPAKEFERDYLTAFRAALLAPSVGGHAGRVVAAAVVPLRTVPEP